MVRWNCSYCHEELFNEDFEAGTFRDCPLCKALLTVPRGNRSVSSTDTEEQHVNRIRFGVRRSLAIFLIGIDAFLILWLIVVVASGKKRVVDVALKDHGGRNAEESQSSIERNITRQPPNTKLRTDSSPSLPTAQQMKPSSMKNQLDDRLEATLPPRLTDNSRPMKDTTSVQQSTDNFGPKKDTLLTPRPVDITGVKKDSSLPVQPANITGPKNDGPSVAGKIDEVKKGANSIGDLADYVAALKGKVPLTVDDFREKGWKAISSETDEKTGTFRVVTVSIDPIQLTEKQTGRTGRFTKAILTRNTPKPTIPPGTRISAADIGRLTRQAALNSALYWEKVELLP